MPTMLPLVWNSYRALVTPIRWFTRERDGTVPTFTVAAIDTTAAGDAFVGALLQRLVERADCTDERIARIDDPAGMHEALRYAAASGALATTRHGAFAAMPGRDDVDRLLRNDCGSAHASGDVLHQYPSRRIA